MWLKLTTVTFHGTGRNKTSTVKNLRINMDTIESYFEASDDVKNNPSEQARANTILIAYGDRDKAYHAKETVEEIDKMINCGWANVQPDMRIVLADEGTRISTPTEQIVKNDNSWSDWK